VILSIITIPLALSIVVRMNLAAAIPIPATRVTLETPATLETRALHAFRTFGAAQAVVAGAKEVKGAVEQQAVRDLPPGNNRDTDNERRLFNLPRRNRHWYSDVQPM
jgi:hypothetical protein